MRGFGLRLALVRGLGFRGGRAMQVNFILSFDLVQIGLRFCFHGFRCLRCSTDIVFKRCDDLSPRVLTGEVDEDFLHRFPRLIFTSNRRG